MKKTKRSAFSSEKEGFTQKRYSHSKSKKRESWFVVDHNRRNSLGPTSPKPVSFMGKYRTYVEFITSNQLGAKIASKGNGHSFDKKPVTPTHRKNSPVPYAKGRQSAFCRFAQHSPMNYTTKQRNSFPKARPEQTSVANKLQICGNKLNQNRHQRTNKSKDNSILMNKRNPNSIRCQKKGKKLTKKKENKGVTNRSGMQSGRETIELEQRQLCEKLFKGIEFYRDLGKGSHALVRSAVDWNNKRKIAIKVYEKAEMTEEQLRSIEKQIEILRVLNHANIIKLWETIETFKTINLVMEYGGGNSLEQYIKSKPKGYLCEEECRLIFTQILDAVTYLHQMNVTHRDIKTENILLNKHLNLKIIDFGFSLVTPPNAHISTYCGTPTYMAPEVVSKTPHNPQLADRWSLGVLLFTIMNGHCPFTASTQKDLFQKICKGEYKHSVNVSAPARSLISLFLNLQPADRITPSQALSHPWIVSMK